MMSILFALVFPSFVLFVQIVLIEIISFLLISIEEHLEI